MRMRRVSSTGDSSSSVGVWHAARSRAQANVTKQVARRRMASLQRWLTIACYAHRFECRRSVFPAPVARFPPYGRWVRADRLQGLVTRFQGTLTASIPGKPASDPVQLAFAVACRTRATLGPQRQDVIETFGDAVKPKDR